MRFQNCTLIGLLEFFLSAEAAGDQASRLWLGDTAHPVMGRLTNYLYGVWNGKHRFTPAAVQKAKAIEFFKLDSLLLVDPQSDRNLELHQYEERLVASAKHVGLPQRISYGLASVIHELIENVFQHSDCDDKTAFRGITGYHASPDYFAFAVCDLGVGALKSLQSSIQWKHLRDDREALDAIISKYASRKTGLGPGEGLKTVLKNLADRNASVRIRSGSQSALVIGVDSGREVRWASSPHLEGVQVSVIWRKGVELEEKEIFPLTQ